MKNKAIISVLLALLFVMFLSGAVDNEKALDLIKRGNESYRAHKIPSQAFTYFKQAADLATGYVKVDALLKRRTCPICRAIKSRLTRISSRMP